MRHRLAGNVRATPQLGHPLFAIVVDGDEQTSMLSAVHRGTAFEQRSLHLLQTHFSMALRRVGGRSDGGIDLVGWWWLPFTTESEPVHRPGALPDPDGRLRRRLRVLAQCKAEKKKFSPKYVREMEGVWHLQSPAEHTPASTAYPTVALLLSESPFSRSTALHAYRSTVPFLLVHFPPPSVTSTDTTVVGGTICPNPALTRLVRPLAFRWERRSDPDPTHPTEDVSLLMGGRPGLWWQGRKLDSWAPEFAQADTA